MANKNFNELREAINELAKGQTDTEVLKNLGATLKKVDDIEVEYDKSIQDQDKLRKDYIEAVKGNSFKQDPNDDDKKEVTLEELMRKKMQEEQAQK